MLRTDADGKLYPTFREFVNEKCPELNSDRTSWLHTFFDYEVNGLRRTPPSLRRTFRLLMFAHPQQWGWPEVEQYFKDLTCDWSKHAVAGQSAAEKKFLQNKLLTMLAGEEGILSENFWRGGASVAYQRVESTSELKEISTHVNLEEYSKEKLKGAPSQEKAFATIMEAAKSAGKSSVRAFLLQAWAGTGKSFLMNTIMKEAQTLGIKFVACASTGAASQQLFSGKTCHRAFGLKFKMDNQDTWEDLMLLGPGTKQYAELRAATIYIFDEVYMQHRRHVESMMETIRGFGGNGPRVLVFVGDRYQLSVVERTEAHAVRSSPLQYLVPIAEPLELSDPQRQKHDLPFFKWLTETAATTDGVLDVERGGVKAIQQEEIEEFLWTNTKKFLKKNTGRGQEFPALVVRNLQKMAGSRAVFRTNREVHEFNDRVIGELGGERCVLQVGQINKSNGDNV